MATLTETRERSGVGYEPKDRRTRWLIAAIVVLSVALVGLGIWAILMWSSANQTALTPDVEVAMEDYYTAWNNHDGEAFLDTVSSGYIFEFQGMTWTEGVMAPAIESGVGTEWTVEMIGEPIMSGDGPWYVAAVDLVRDPGDDPDGMEGLSRYTLIEDDGVVKVLHHVFLSE